MSKIRADRRIGLLLAGVILLTFVAIGATIALPATDKSLRTKPVAMTAARAHGMKVFTAEGCWYCHTGYVRTTATDASLGKPLSAKAYAGMSPALLGLERMGGDLTYLKTRFPDAASLIAYLKAPGKSGRVTSMPSYGYLSPSDLEALASYLLSSR